MTAGHLWDRERSVAGSHDRGDQITRAPEFNDEIEVAFWEYRPESPDQQNAG